MNNIIIESMAFTLPLFIISIGGIFCEGSGVINLALEGLLGMGAFFGGFIVALLTNAFVNSQSSLVYLSLFAAMVGGALFAMLYALIVLKLQANQVISGVVINMLSVALTAFLTNQLNISIFGQSSNKFMLFVFPRVTVPYLSQIPILGAFFTNVYVFEFIIVVIALFMAYLLYKTPFGMRLRACGDNPQAVAAAGKSVIKIRFIAILISGAMSGLGGMCFAYSISTNFSPSIYVGYGYLAIAAYIFGNWKIPNTLLACLIFGFARSIGYFFVQKLGFPSSYSDLVLTFPYILTLLLLLFFSKSNKAPRALGEVYDKGKR
ncbi:MAG: ABC transporter permease [Pleomorphochaeta sp.]|jgi:simple sugar transport system permease protein